MTFRARIVAVVVLVTAVAIGIAFTAVSLAFNYFQGRNFDHALERVAAQEAASVSGEQLAMSDQLNEADAAVVRSLTKFAVLYSETGTVVCSTGTFKGSPPPLATLRGFGSSPFDFRHGDSHLRGIFRPLPQHPSRFLFVGIPRDDPDEDEAFLRRAMVVAALLSILWVAAVTHWTLGRLTRDHHAIASVVRRVASGDLAARVGPRTADPEVEQLARDLDQMIGQLDHLVTSQRRFVAHAAHELRSPLTAVSVELQLALRSAHDVPTYRRAVSEALDSSTRLIELANDLLVLARVQTRSSDGAQRCALDEIVSAATSPVESLARERGVRLETSDLSGSVHGNRNDLQRLVRNLVENAVRHAPRGTSVTVTGGRGHGSYEIEVQDVGPGIRREDRERVFEPFFRSGASRSDDDGAGLGLGIAREIARTHGGDVILVDVPRGCVFRIVLPDAETSNGVRLAAASAGGSERPQASAE